MSVLLRILVLGKGRLYNVNSGEKHQFHQINPECISEYFN